MDEAKAEIAKRGDPNDHIRSYLQFYCDSTRSLGYAVLIDGRWGSGKTYLIKDFLAKRSHKHLYASLYGITTYQQVEDEFFRQLHPILSSEVTKIAARIFRGSIKAALKIDLDTSSKEAINLNGELPAIDVRKLMADPEDRLLVFDDLERCSMPTADVLGYINSFVEHNDCKAIIIANTAEIIQEAERFQRIKEKLIGQSFEVRASFGDVYPHLMALIEDEWAREFLKEGEEEIGEVFAQSDTHNLRALKQVLWDCERVLRCLRDADRIHREALREIILSLLALGLEFKTGRLSPEDLGGVGNRFSRYLRSKERELTAFDKAEDRYGSVDLHQSILSPGVVRKLLVEGLVEPGEVTDALDQRAPFTPIASLPDWQRAWQGFTSDDAAYEAALTEVRTGFASRKYDEPGVVMHVIGILLLASRIGAISETPDNIAQDGSNYLDELYDTHRVPAEQDKFRSLLDSMGHASMAYQEADTTIFQTLKSKYHELMKRVEQDSMPKRAAALVALMKENAREFARQILYVNDAPSPYWRVPIFIYVKPEGFVDELLTLPSDAQTLVLQALEKRYEEAEQTSPRPLSEEDEWRAQVGEIIRARLSRLRPMARHRITLMLKRGFGFADE